MSISYFNNKSQCPGEKDLAEALGKKTEQWKKIRKFTHDFYPMAMEEWIYSGKNYGWSFQIKDRKRVIIYFIPCDGYFKVAFVLGEKAVAEALNSNISEDIKKLIRSAPAHAEGKGFRIDINDDYLVDDVKKLVTIKLAN
jgi:hypothetical protein